MRVDRILMLRAAEAEGAGGAADGGGQAGATAGGAAGADGGAGGQAGAKAAANWRDALPEDIRGDKRFEKYADLGALAKGFKELDEFRGRAIVPPGKDATPEERAKFYDRLGRPKTHKDYKIDLGEGFEIRDQAALDTYLEAFHGAGLTGEQANALARFEASRVKAAMEARGKALKADWDALDTEWGDKKAGNLEVAKRAAGALGLKKADIEALGNASGSHAQVVRLLHKIGLSLAEDTSVGSKDRDSGGETPAAIQKQIDELMVSKEYRANDPAAHEKVRGLFLKLYPAQAAA